MGIREFLSKNNIAVLEQPPYSPNLAPCDFFLFPKLKEVIKGTRFQDSEAIKTAVGRAPNDSGGILLGVRGGSSVARGGGALAPPLACRPKCRMRKTLRF